MSRWLLYALVSVVMYGMCGFLAGLNDRDEAHWLVTSTPMTIGVVPVLIPTGIVKVPAREGNPRRGVAFALLTGFIGAPN
jgi:uncharacterized membrane protein